MHFGRRIYQLAVALAGSSALFAGCASPGPPRPPSLHLPRPAIGFSAERIGNVVHLRWTVPTESTDDLPLTGKRGSGPLQADICRAEGNSACMPLRSLPVAAGEIATTEDTLPPKLVSGPPHLLQYRIVLRNASGHAAENSPSAMIAGGPGPAPMTALSAESRADGVHLHWAAAPGGAELILQRSPVPLETTPATQQKAAADQTLSVKVDKGGAVDTLATFDRSYTYTVGRVKNLHLEGQAVAIKGTPATVIVDRRSDAFPPTVPTGLVALEVTASSPSDGNAAAAEEVNLSWQPNTEPDLQGYMVYRLQGGSTGAPQRLTPKPIAALSYDDFSAKPGIVYRYSISAVNTSGKESARSTEISSR